MKKVMSFILRIFAGIAVLVVTIGIYILIGAIQEKLFVPKEYTMWIFKYPLSRLIFIYELYPLFIFYYIFKKEGRGSIKRFIKKYRMPLFTIFAALNIVLFYTIITNVTVLTKNKIIDYNFFSPQGEEYSYNEVVKINTGVYGKNLRIPFTHSKGDFFYIIELNDGTKIDLTELGGAKNDVDERFILEKLDRQLVNQGVHKNASMANFTYSTKDLAKIYTDKIRTILKNIK